MANAFHIVDIMPGVRNVIDYAHVQRGEQVVVSTDTLTDPMIAQALFIAAEERGAEVTLTVTRPGGLSWREGVDAPRPYRNAVYAADVWIEVVPFEGQHFPRLQETAMVEHGVRKVVLFGITAEDLASEWTRFPWGLMQFMTRRIYDIWTRGATGPSPKHKTMRVTAANGTDLTVRYDPRYVIHNGFIAERLLRGQWCPLAGATVGIELFADANGRVTFDGLHGEEEYKALPPVGSDVVYPLSEPVHWFFRDRRASIEGGAEAEVMKRIVAKGGPFATILCEIALGVNPKAPLLTHPTRHAGVTHFAIGSTAGRAPTPEKEYAPVHTHGHVLRASLDVDGERVIDHGRLLALDDPEVRTVAARYGDPDRLLKEIAF
jgi:hypothetical protein